jgi:hypothetical protein
VNLLSSHLDYHLELNPTDHVEIEQPKGDKKVHGPPRAFACRINHVLPYCIRELEQSEPLPIFHLAYLSVVLSEISLLPMRSNISILVIKFEICSMVDFKTGFAPLAPFI